MKRAIFIDFDGTITKTDTTLAMIKTFARDGWQELNKLWEEKKLSTADCANRTFKLFDASIEDLESLLDTIEIDEYFMEFLSLYNNSSDKIYILSDGYDFNIQRILNRYGIDLKFYANKLLYSREEGFSIECPHQNLQCKNCGTCKTGLIKQLKGEGDRVIYIGDSYSDMCPAELADVVFAKEVLYSYCSEKGLNVKCFKNFGDIIRTGL